MEYIKSYKKFKIFYEEDIDMFTTFIDDLDVSANSVNLLQEKINKMKEEDNTIKYTPEYKDVYQASKGIPGDLINDSIQKTKDFINRNADLFSNSNDFVKFSTSPYVYIDKYWSVLEILRLRLLTEIENMPNHNYEIFISYDGNPKHNEFIKNINRKYKHKFFEKIHDYFFKVSLLDTEILGYFLFTGILSIRDINKSTSIGVRFFKERALINRLKKINNINIDY